MSILRLDRYNYADTETEGDLWLPGEDGPTIHTLERPWLPGLPGGLSFESCVPDGAYELIPHIRPNGDNVYALRNPDLGVYYTEQERGANAGRYLILIHSANWVEQVVGCIAPGLVRTIAENKRMVRSSRAAVGQIMVVPKLTEIHIRPALGTT